MRLGVVAWASPRLSHSCRGGVRRAFEANGLLHLQICAPGSLRVAVRAWSRRRGTVLHRRRPGHDKKPARKRAALRVTLPDVTSASGCHPHPHAARGLPNVVPERRRDTQPTSNEL
ncbi:hypothetical protein PHLGIDRAFT_384842 [Phlebiopsis gigantea 11061_1 CR5-6]|uniref:Uncharacterized protein n=1 Tax=Phlebiopsis gigantea (strain 11061_1 CR5-6) TaxID=745531 RepID=A0A0C3NSR4_PHLG1|nr:hypothetical protein PHLGIDRAFT_384842 [Phlebiopsis gigantea 11061_1 CR5-6]